MPRPLKGSHRLRDNHVYLRFRGHEWRAGPRAEWPDTRISEELDRIVSAYKAGVWQGPPRNGSVAASTNGRGPRFEVVADEYLVRQKARNLADNTYADIAHRVHHLNDFFADRPMHDLDTAAIESYQAYKVREAEYLRAIKARFKAGDDTLTEDEIVLARQANRIGLTAATINRTVVTLANIIERYQSRPGALRAMPVNPARDKNLRLNVTKKRSRSYLEPTQTEALFEGAKLLEDEARADRRVLGRFEMVATLVCTGIRIGELCNLDRRDVNLEVRKLMVEDSKTEKGVREVWFSPFLADVLRVWMTERQTTYTSPDDPLFPSTRGGRRDEDRFRDRILANAVAQAGVLLARRGQTPMPRHITPHTLRRTYITYAAEVGFSIRYIMNQVGHLDSTLTVEVYNQLMVERDDPRIPLWVGSPRVRTQG